MGKTPDETDQGYCFDALLAAVLDPNGKVTHWSTPAADALGLAAADALGRPAAELLHPDENGATGPIPATGRARLHHTSGTPLDVAVRRIPLDDGGALLLAAPADTAAEWGHGVALLRTVLAQDRLAIAVHDADLHVLRSTTPAPGHPDDALTEFADSAMLRGVLSTGRPVVDQVQERPPRTVARSAFRLHDAHGNPTGVVSVLRDITEQRRLREHLELLRSASRVGTTLDIVGVAEALLEVLVPALGDLGTVELAEGVLEGEEPPKMLGGSTHLVRAAGVTKSGHWPPGLLPPGTTYPLLPVTADLLTVQQGEVVVTDREGGIAAVGEDQQHLFVPGEGREVMVLPLLTKDGRELGLVSVWRYHSWPEPFAEDEELLIQEICSRAALALDNARRFSREHRVNASLQEQLLPPPGTDTISAETAGTYQPARGGAGISGDWYDVIPLPCLRVALVIGDVIGHGLPAIATMGRLRTAVQTLARMELPPRDILYRLNDLVETLAAEAPDDKRDTIGATCLVVVYDPVDGQCAMASAGHPPPAAVTPDGTVQYIDLDPGPPLGIGGLPYPTRTLTLEPGTVLSLYTDGLLTRGQTAPGDGMEHLRDDLAALCRIHPLNDIGPALLETGGAQRDDERDDIALLLARTRLLAPHNTVFWEFDAQPHSVGEARSAVGKQLEIWGVTEEQAAFTCELVTSELVTNAMRHASGPIGVRLIRTPAKIIIEVSDPQSTHPQMRFAEEDDESGRGLFLVAQLCAQWGSRYFPRGKRIWGEIDRKSPAAEPILAPFGPSSVESL